MQVDAMGYIGPRYIEARDALAAYRDLMNQLTSDNDESIIKP